MNYSASKYSVTLGVRGCSRSLKMPPFDRSYTTFYWFAIVIIALSGTVFELFDVEWYHDFEIWVCDHSRSFKPVAFESLGAISYSPTMALACIICQIKRDTGRKSWFFHTPIVFDAPVRGGSHRNIAIPFCVGKLEWWGYPMVKKIEDRCNRLDSIPACDRRTDRQRDRHGHFATA